MELRDFGWALAQLHQGNKVARSGWNGSDLYLYLVPGSVFTVNRAPLNTLLPEGTEVNYRPHIDLFNTANNTAETWAPTNNDALAEDWELVE